jgi:hypothetical protein
VKEDLNDRFTRGVVASVEEAIGTVLRRSGLRVLTDSQSAGVIVADTGPVDGADVLGL